MARQPAVQAATTDGNEFASVHPLGAGLTRRNAMPTETPRLPARSMTRLTRRWFPLFNTAGKIVTHARRTLLRFPGALHHAELVRVRVKIVRLAPAYPEIGRRRFPLTLWVSFDNLIFAYPA
jgi:hypothetical protein